MSKLKVTLVNDFHNTRVNIVLNISDKGYFSMSKYQDRKIFKELCGHDECTCGVVRGKCFETEPSNFIPFNYEYDDEIDGIYKYRRVT